MRYHRLADIGPLAGNVTQFALLDLPTAIIPGAIPDSHENTLGINEAGEVVGGFFSGATSAVHAFVWLPRARYGLPAGVTDLHSAVWGNSGGSMSWAGDINESGLVVGQKGQNVSSICHAHVWTLGSTITATDLHTTSGGFSAASAINDETIARVAGQTTLACPEPLSVTCQPPCLPEDLEFVGFQRTVSPADSMEILLGYESPGALANGLRTSSPQRIAGGDFGSLEACPDPCCIDPFPPFSCTHPPNDSLVWTLGGGGAMVTDLNGLGADALLGALAADINEDGDVVGLGWTGVQGNCPAFALSWTDTGSPPNARSLGHVFPTPLPSRAHALTDRDEHGCVTVVGRALEGDDGLIWYGSDDSWCAAKMNDLVLDSGCVDVNGRVIIAAHDVNSRRIVAVVYTREVPSPNFLEYRAGLITDAADLNGDLRINSLDRAILMAAYCGGGNPPCTGKPEADLNCDGVVDSGDLAIFASRWTGSALLALRPICQCGASGSLAAAGEFDEVAAAIEAMALLGFDPESFSDWLKEASEGAADSACEFIGLWVESKKGGAG